MDIKELQEAIQYFALLAMSNNEQQRIMASRAVRAFGLVLQMPQMVKDLEDKTLALQGLTDVVELLQTRCDELEAVVVKLFAYDSLQYVTRDYKNVWHCEICGGESHTYARELIHSFDCAYTKAKLLAASNAPGNT